MTKIKLKTNILFQMKKSLTKEKDLRVSLTKKPIGFRPCAGDKNSQSSSSELMINSKSSQSS